MSDYSNQIFVCFLILEKLDMLVVDCQLIVVIITCTMIIGRTPFPKLTDLGAQSADFKVLPKVVQRSGIFVRNGNVGVIGPPSVHVVQQMGKGFGCCHLFELDAACAALRLGKVLVTKETGKITAPGRQNDAVDVVGCSSCSASLIL